MRTIARSPAWAAAACVVALGVLLVCAYSIGPFPQVDARALDGLAALRGPVVTPVLNVVAHAGDPLPLALMLAAIAGAGVAIGRRRQALTVVAAVVGANVTTQVLKVVLAHPRFHPVLGTNQVGPTGFPSGHATASMSIALAAVVVSPLRLRSRVALLGLLFAFAVATSILVLDWHYPSDVLGGMLVAAAFAFGTVAGARALAGREEPLGAPFSVRQLVPPVPLVAAVGAAAAAVLAARHDDLVQFARAHTIGAAALAGLIAVCATLLAGASRLADR